jgi:hypothetical protein
MIFEKLLPCMAQRNEERAQKTQLQFRNISPRGVFPPDMAGSFKATTTL